MVIIVVVTSLPVTTTDNGEKGLATNPSK